MRQTSIIAGLIVALALAGCRGTESDEPPVHPVWNMDDVQRFDPQESNSFFEDDAAMRPIVAGTVARGMLKDNPRFYEGRTESGAYVEEIPIPVTRALLERGQERYNIYCTPCHGRAGNGKGIIMTGSYGYAPAPSYHIDRLRQAPDGYLFDVITNGIRNMPSYAHQVPVADRWAIVAYVRALQRSQHATAEDLPPSALARVTQDQQEAALAAPPTGGAAASDTASTGEPASTPEEASNTPAADTTTTAAASDDAAAEEGTSSATAKASVDTTTVADTAAAADTAAVGNEEVTVTDEAAGEPASGAPASEVPAQEAGATAPAPATQATGGGGIPTGFLLVAFVGLPIVVLVTLLVVAFRKKREH